MSKTKLFNLLTLGAITLGLVGCGEVQEEPKEVIKIEVPTEEKEEVKQEVQEEVKQQEVKMNEPLTIKEFGEDLLQIKITDIRFTEERNEFEERQFESVVVVKVELQNIGTEQTFVDGGDLFNVYDTEGNVLETYANSDYEFDRAYEINPTRKATIEIAYGIPTGTEFELEVVEDIWDGGVLGSLFFKGTEQVTEEQSPINRAEDIINNVGETIKGESKEEVKQQGDYILEHDGYSFEGKEYKEIGERGLHKDVDKQIASEIVEVFKDCEYELYKVDEPSPIHKAWVLLLYNGTRKDFVEDMTKDVETHFSGMLGIAFVSSLLQDVNISVIGTDGYEIYSYQNGEEGVSIEKWATEKQMNDMLQAIESSEELQQQFEDLE